MSRNRPDASYSTQDREARRAHCRTDRGSVRTEWSRQWRGTGLPSAGSPESPSRTVQGSSRSGARSRSTGPSSRPVIGASVCSCGQSSRPPAARQAGSGQPGAGNACGTTCRPLRKKHGHCPDCIRSQPGGLPEGSRWSYGARGERPPEDVYWVCAPRRGARCGLDTLHPGSLDRSLRNQSGTRAGVQVNSCAAIRRSPPPRPPSTSGYPLPTLRVDKARMSKFQRADRPAESAILLATHPHRSHTTPMGKERNIAVSEDSLSDFARERLYMI